MQEEPSGAGAGAGRARGTPEELCFVAWRRAHADVHGPFASRAEGRRKASGRGKARVRAREGKGGRGWGEEGIFDHVTGAARPGVSVWRRLR